jgi:hypothetical protein
LSTENRNTTRSLGLSLTDDTIDLNKPNVVEAKKQDSNEKKKVIAGLFGMTKILSKEDIVQLNLGHSNGNGYYTDPYKAFDQRPGERNKMTALTRWNHHFESTDGTARLSYRYYTDTFGVWCSHSGIESSKELGRNWLVDVKYEDYEQRGDWCVNGTGDHGLAAFSARSVQLGVSRAF